MKALLFLLLLPGPAAAQDFSGADRAWSIAAGTAGAALLGVGGAAAAAAVVGDSPELGGFEDLAAAAFIGLPLGLTAGATGAVFAYGELSGHDGGLLPTLAGGTVGTLAGFGLFIVTGIIDSDLLPLGLVFLATSPAVGATVAYELSLGAEEKAPPVSGALLDYSPTAGLRLSLPALGAVADEHGRFALALPLLAGRF